MLYKNICPISYSSYFLAFFSLKGRNERMHHYIGQFVKVSALVDTISKTLFLKLLFSCDYVQVRVATRKNCEPLEEDSFRPILHHYDGPKFRLELNIPEVLPVIRINSFHSKQCHVFHPHLKNLADLFFPGTGTPGHFRREQSLNES